MKLTPIEKWFAGVVSTLICVTSFAAPVIEPRPLTVPEIHDLIEPWLFVRASEASTLFIDEAFEGREPYGHLIVQGEEQFQWLEFDGTMTHLWKVSAFVRNKKQLTLTLLPAAKNDQKKPSRLVIYPYWDIDHCLIMIRFEPGAKENPVRFSTPYGFKNDLPYLAPEG